MNQRLEQLWNDNTPESDETMIILANDLVQKNDSDGMALLGKAYRLGRGVGIDLSLSKHWLKIAVDSGNNSVVNDLLLVLYNINDYESSLDFIRYATDLANKGDSFGMAMLGRAYRDGYGVRPSLEEAVKWMEKASSKTPFWNTELSLLLDQYNQERAIREEIDPTVLQIFDKVHSDIHKKISNKKTIVYNFGHISAIIPMIALSTRVNESYNKIVVTCYSSRYVDVFNKLVKNGIFDKIIYYGREKHTKEENGIELIQNVTTYFNTLFIQNKVDPSTICQSYVFSDNTNNYLLYAYTYLFNINVVEPSLNAFKNKDLLTIAFRLHFVSKCYSDLQFFTGLLNGSRNCKRISYSMAGSDYKSLNPVSEIKKLSLSSKNAIFNAFKINEVSEYFVPQYVIMNSGTLGNYMRLMDEDVVALYQLILDYFGNDSVKTVIKIHPQDEKMYFDDTFHNFTYAGNYPFELLGALDSVYIHQLFSINTTAIQKISKNIHIEKSMKFPSLFGYFYILDSLNVVCNYLHSLPYRFKITQYICENETFTHIWKHDKKDCDELSVLMTIDLTILDKKPINFIESFDLIVIFPNNHKICNAIIEGLQALSESNVFLYKLCVRIDRTNPISVFYDHEDEIILVSKNKIDCEYYLFNYSKMCQNCNTKVTCSELQVLERCDEGRRTLPPGIFTTIPTEIASIRFPIPESIEYQIYQMDCCANGIGRQTDIDAAIEWGKYASSNYSTSATFRLFKLLLIRNNATDAEHAYNLAEKMPSSKKYLMLAELYYRGIYVDKDASKAKKMLMLAIDSDVPWSIENVYLPLYSEEDQKEIEKLKKLYFEIFKKNKDGRINM